MCGIDQLCSWFSIFATFISWLLTIFWVSDVCAKLSYKDVELSLDLRDVRSTKFNDFVLIMIDSNLANGPVYFNYFPKFSMNINDPSILSSLTLNITTKNMNFVEAQTIAIIYRIYYKIMTIQLNLRVVCQSLKEETL